jgi:hypothetical protein
MSNNKILTSGPYSGMSIEEIVSADPWYVASLVRAGGNHGISEGMYNRAQRIIEENEKDEHEQYDELIQGSADALGYDIEFDEFEEKYG